MSTESNSGRPPKRDCRGKFVHNDEEIAQWLQDLEEDDQFSDFDDSTADPDYLEVEEQQEVRSEEPTNENDGQSNESEESDEEQPVVASGSQDEQPIVASGSQDEQPVVASGSQEEQPVIASGSQNCNQGGPNYMGKDGYVWSKEEISRTSRTPAHNIINVSRPNEDLVFTSYEKLWSKLFDSSMLQTVILYTNRKLEAYRQQFSDTSRHELRDTNETEMRSLLGILYYSSVFKCNDADANYLFATDGTGHEIFRCVMSKVRFSTLLNCLRFDDAANRQERLKTDRLAAISALFDKFITNSQENYVPGANLCIDEMLIPFRGRCKFVMYMPNKPAKYGIKVLVLSDAETYYTYNAYIYCGKGSDGEGLSTAEKSLGVPTQSVLKLAQPVVNSNRNITADNWFSSIPLMQILKEKKLTYLGTLKKNKREIPPEFLPNKKREPGSALYGFTKDFTMVSFVPKKNKAVILISSSHHSKSTDAETSKPTMIVDYNHTKGGVDEIDKKCSIYSCSRKTRRWPMSTFYRIMDLAGTNAFVLYQSCRGAKLRRGDFLLNLAREMVLPCMKERVYNTRLPRELRLTISRVLGKDLPPPQPEAEVPGPAVRKLCSICPSKLKRKSRYSCCACKKTICLQCSLQICENCKINF